MDFLISLLAFTVVIGIMVLVHEWGHFIAARAFGIRVDIFSFGMGPRIWGRKRGETDYRLSAFPLGGYVKMAGDNPAEDRSGAPDEFLSKPRWQRLIVIVAGPTMNILVAFLLMTGLYLKGAPQRPFEGQPAEIAAVFPGSPAEKAGIRAGDTIVELEGSSTSAWNRVMMNLVFIDPRKPLGLVVQRDGQRVRLTVTATEADVRAGDVFALLGFPADPVIVGRVSSDGPGGRGGLKPGDEIVAVNGEPVVSPEYFRQLIQQNENKPITLLVNRGETQMTLQMRPERGDRGDGVQAWLIGFSFEHARAIRSYGLLEAAENSVWYNVLIAKKIVALVGRLFTGGASIKQLGGPIEIARQSGQAARQGPLTLITLMAFISMNLGLLNLLPIPILDGGHVLMLGIEGAIRRDLSVAVKERFVQVGLVFLLLIFVTVMYNDILKLNLLKWWSGQ